MSTLQLIFDVSAFNPGHPFMADSLCFRISHFGGGGQALDDGLANRRLKFVPSHW